MLAGYDTHPRTECVREMWGTNLRVDDKMLGCVVFLGRDDQGPFTAYGTGFWAVTSTSGYLFQHLISARHVIENINFDRICVRINKLDGRLEHIYVKRDDWIFHSDETVDIAVCPMHVPQESYDITHISLDDEITTPEIFADEEIGVGDEVFMAGMFTRHLGGARNVPIVRTGTLAAIPTDKVETNRGPVEAYLIEARSIAGLSGSPVFMHMAPFRVLPGGRVHRSEKRTHYFLGVMQGHHVTSDPTEVVSPDEAAPGDMNTGIGVVIPAQRILDIVYSPDLVSLREQVIENMKKKSGFVADSAAGKAPATKDENPRHKEDFSRLLDAAVKDPQSTDQT